MKITKLNARGFSHEIIMVAIVTLFAIGGVGYIVASHADSCPAVSSATSAGAASSPSSADCAPASAPASSAASSPQETPSQSGSSKPPATTTAQPSQPAKAPTTGRPATSPSAASTAPAQTTGGSANSAKSDALYRYYNRTTHTYIMSYTKVDPGKEYSGVGTVFKSFPAPAAGTVAVHLLTKANDQYYTINANDIKHMLQYGWQENPAPFYVYPAKTASSQPVYRLADHKKQHYLFTASKTEVTNLKKSGWDSQGIVFYTTTK